MGNDADAQIIVDKARLCLAVDAQAETRGYGIVVLANQDAVRIRYASDAAPDVIFDVRACSAKEQAPRPKPDASVSPAVEWLSLGLNCGGMVLSWVGVAGTAAISPETGGASLALTAWLWTGAVATTGQCTASAYRVANVFRGREDINQALDKNRMYYWTMTGADFIGLVSAGGAIKEMARTASALKEAGVSLQAARAAEMSRPQRRILTETLELTGAKRVPAERISAVVKSRLLDMTNGAFGIGGSALSGIVHEVAVWIAYSEEPQQG